MENSARSSCLSPTSAPGRRSGIKRFMAPSLPRFLLFLDALQLGATPLHGLQELAEVVLEVRKDLVGVVLGAQADLALAPAGVFHDLRAPLLGPLEDLFFRGDLLGLVLGAADDTVALAARLV